MFGMCKSQHTTDVKAQHERRARRKDTKSVKEIHAHLNLQPPRCPIASEGEESPHIESFEERVARFDVETLVQRWYRDASFSGFGFDYGDMAGPSSSHLLYLTPLLRQIRKMTKKVKKVKKKTMTMSEASRRPPQ
jgi:hypothetical protein